MSRPIRPAVTIADLELSPFKQGEHYESRDGGISEQFVILEGRGDYRFGENTYVVKAGDVLGAPRGGREYAHKLTNTGDAPLKYLMISSKSDIEICEYPDSNKFGIFDSRDPSFRFLGREEDAKDYWDGEET